MTFDSDSFPVSTRRSEIYREFNYSNKIIRVFDLEEERKELIAKLSKLDNDLTEAKNDLPKEIISLYEQMRVIDKLKGNND